MTKEEREQYKDKKPIAVFPIGSYLGVEILDIQHGIDDRAIYKYSDSDKIFSAKIKYGKRDSFRTDNYTVFLDECLRV